MPSEQNLVLIIQQMIAAGETEDRILASLRELGVKKEAAQKLLKVAQSDASSFRKSEINDSVRDVFEQEKPDMIRSTVSEVEKKQDAQYASLETHFDEKFQSAEKEFEEKLSHSESKISETAVKAMNISEVAQEKVAELESRIHKLETGSMESPVPRSEKGPRRVSVLLLGIGILVGAATVFLAFGNPFNPSLNVSMPVLVLAALSIATLFFSTLV